jgi:hypothetical protein
MSLLIYSFIGDNYNKAQITDRITYSMEPKRGCGYEGVWVFFSDETYVHPAIFFTFKYIYIFLLLPLAFDEQTENKKNASIENQTR